MCVEYAEFAWMIYGLIKPFVFIILSLPARVQPVPPYQGFIWISPNFVKTDDESQFEKKTRKRRISSRSKRPSKNWQRHRHRSLNTRRTVHGRVAGCLIEFVENLRLLYVVARFDIRPGFWVTSLSIRSKKPGLPEFSVESNQSSRSVAVHVFYDNEMSLVYVTCEERRKQRNSEQGIFFKIKRYLKIRR